MNLSIQDELQPFAEELKRYVTPVFLEELGFVKRKRKFSSSDLATICIWISQRVASDSLVRLCSRLHAATGTLLSPEGLNKRLKLNTNVYMKNPNPECFKNGAIKKQLEYIQIDVKQILNQLQPGETFELKHAYIGDKQQLFARVIFNRLTERQLQKRQAKIAEKEKSQNRTYSEKSKMIAGLNVYVTNIPWEWVPME